jgi:hypothetical protein
MSRPPTLKIAGGTEKKRKPFPGEVNRENRRLVMAKKFGKIRKAHPGVLTKLTRGVISQICDLIRTGSWLEQAACIVGVTKMALNIWGKRGNEAIKKRDRGELLMADERLYAKYVEEVRRALAECEAVDIYRIDCAAEIWWQAAAWRLERRFKERWGQKTVLEGGDPSKPIQLSGNDETAIERRRLFLIAALTKLHAEHQAQGDGVGASGGVGSDQRASLPPLLEPPARTTDQGA